MRLLLINPRFPESFWSFGYYRNRGYRTVAGGSFASLCPERPAVRAPLYRSRHRRTHAVVGLSNVRETARRGQGICCSLYGA